MMAIKFAFDTFYKTLREIHEDFQRRKRAVLDNDDLSKAGKERAIERIKEERAAVLAKLKSTFDGDVTKKRGILTRKADTKPSPRETLRRRAREETELLNSSYSQDVTVNLLLEAVEDLQATLVNFLEMQSLSHRDEKWFCSQLEQGLKSKDVSQLERLSKALPPLHDGDISERLQSEYSAIISSLKEEILTPAERASRDEISELDKAVELFNYTLANLDNREEYQDARPQEPENETVLRPVNPNPRLGVSPTADRFARYKNSGGGPDGN